MIYLDNAATSWPKPPEVLKAMASALECAGGNPGRSGHRLSIEAARIVYDTRETIAEYFHVSDSLRVIFTGNATHAINLALHGLLKRGDRIVTTSMEHNAVMRPLRYLAARGISLQIVPCASDGSLDVEDVARALKSRTRLVVLNHASNVVGTISPVTDVARLAHKAGALLLVDAAQTAGALTIDMQAMGIDLLAFTGHKGLLGPSGIGGLILGDGINASQLEPQVQGGTGSWSEMEEQPDFLPDKFESGTLNLVGIAGLRAGIQWVSGRSIEAIRAGEKELTRALLDGLGAIPGVRVYGPHDPQKSIAVVSFDVAGRSVSDIGLKLDEEHGILCRVGLHCAPAAHRTIGSFPQGTVRLAPGALTTTDDIGKTMQALEKVLRS